ncbi:MAG: DUF2304 domain-containing protein [Verrucomicrobia bacterium]|nr:DUF2304 domain-containing protein [Verrucomicrobiota bacterium]MDA1086871.1 DUF2304 domain-containing protein [Verrucomicrobiota bacterium]
MYIQPRQMVACLVASMMLLLFIIRLVQKGRLDIHYCWIWLGIGLGAILTVVKYEWLAAFSVLIGSKTQTTTIFLLGHFVLLLMCLQFALVISRHRREIRRLTQQLAVLTARVSSEPRH